MINYDSNLFDLRKSEISQPSFAKTVAGVHPTTPREGRLSRGLASRRRGSLPMSDGETGRGTFLDG